MQGFFFRHDKLPVAFYKKGTPTTPQCCPMSLVASFIVVRQPTGPYALHRFRVLSLPANHRSLRPASDRILGASPPAECRLLSYL